MKRSLVCLAAFGLASALFARETKPALRGPSSAQLQAAARTPLSGSLAQVRAASGARFDLNAPHPDAVNVGPSETIDLNNSRGFGVRDMRGKPDGFEEPAEPEKKKEEEPGFFQKIAKFIKDADLPGWGLKIGFALGLFGLVTFNVPLMIAGVAVAAVSMLLPLFLG